MEASDVSRLLNDSASDIAGATPTADGVGVTSIAASQEAAQATKKKASVKKNLKNAVWLPDTKSSECFSCHKKFTITRRRHHCRRCGGLFCHGNCDAIECDRY